MNILRDISYGQDSLQKLDIYEPTKTNGAVIFVIHGGGWWQGDKQKETSLASKFADEGYLVIVPNYRLADGENKKNLYPAQNQDMQSVLIWLNNSDYNTSKEKIGIFGSSSGGNLAAELCIKEGYPTTTWSGLFDLEGFYNSHKNTIPKKMIIDANIASSKIDQDGINDEYYKWLIINLLGGDMSKLHDATVINHVNEKSGPMFLVNSINELVPGEEILKLGEKLLKQNQEFQTLILKGNRHGEGYYDDVIDMTLNFFKKYLL